MDASPNDSTRPTEKKSTLIEFPGVSRNSLPEWRKELSERVREVQEKRAREAAHEAAEAERQRMEAAINPPQLELLPSTPMPAMNPLVAAALKRIERAHQTAPVENRQPRTTLATAVAYAPEREENEMSETVSPNQQLAFEPEIPEVETLVVEEKAPHLAVVPVIEPPSARREVLPGAAAGGRRGSDDCGVAGVGAVRNNCVESGDRRPGGQIRISPS